MADRVIWSDAIAADPAVHSAYNDLKRRPEDYESRRAGFFDQLT